LTLTILSAYFCPVNALEGEEGEEKQEILKCVIYTPGKHLSKKKSIAVMI
jgi:hypothetical protein